METIVQALEEIAKQCKAMMACDEDDRISIYRKIDPRLLRLEGELKQKPNTYSAEVMSELKLHLIMIARLYEPDDHSDEQHYASALHAIEILRGANCFALEP